MHRFIQEHPYHLQACKRLRSVMLSDHNTALSRKVNAPRANFAVEVDDDDNRERQLNAGRALAEVQRS